MSLTSDPFPTAAFDYALPVDRIAHYPTEQRDASRLLVLDRSAGTIDHRAFRDLSELIPPGDVLVLNETRVFPARLVGRRTTGGEAEVLLLHPAGGDGGMAGMGDGGITDWVALVRPGNKLRPGRVVEIAEDFRVQVLEVLPDGNRVVRLESDVPVPQALRKYGRTPLPPYIDRDAEASDVDRYQTVYARAEGSVAAPTAGLHFTPELLAGLEAQGVEIVRVVLHVGVGTFRPVETEDPAQHVMHAEQYEVSAGAADRINRARAHGGKVWAVGTTVARTLETVVDEAGRIHPGSGATRLFIRPPATLRAIDRLITNFHLPRSTLLMLVTAFGGYAAVMHAYQVAIEDGYRFYSYGDAMAIL